MYASTLRNTREMGGCLSVSILHKAEYTAVGVNGEAVDDDGDDSSEQDVLIFTIPPKRAVPAAQDGLRVRMKQGVFK
jgi:hypothetical protein